MTEKANELVGETLGNYTLEKLIGEGGMSAVYLVQQKRPARVVAVKVLHSEAKNQDEYTAFLARFQREADIIARLEHVNIIPIYEYGEQDQYAYLVMPYVSGGSLSQLLVRQGRLSIHQALDFMTQAASALDYAHQQHVIHRDLKPSNILLYPDGRLVLADFGIARLNEETKDEQHLTLTSEGTILGTPAYMAPEALRGETVDGRADIYALAVVFYQMLSGEIPFKGENHYAVIDKHLHEAFPALYGVNPEVPLAVDTVLTKATAKDRVERYTTAGEFVKALRDAIHNSEAATEVKATPGGVPPTQPANNAVFEKALQASSTPIPTLQPYPVPSQPQYPYAQPLPPNQAYWQQMPPPGTPMPNEWYQHPVQKREGSWSLALKIIPSLVLLTAIVLISLQVMGAFAQQPATSNNNNVQTNGTVSTTPDTQATPTNTPTFTPTPTPVQYAHNTVKTYYDQLNRHNYQAAYNQLSSNFQSSIPYDTFASGYANVERQDVTFVSEYPNDDGSVTEAVHLVVRERNSQGGIETKDLNWTGIVIQQGDGSWKIDSARFS